MSFKEHISKRAVLYMIILTWPIVESIGPSIVAVGYAALTFLLILRTKDFTNTLLAFLAMLLFSDSRSAIFEFAENSKVFFVLFLFAFVVFNYKKLEVKKNEIFVLFLPYLIFAVLSSLWAVSTFTAFQKSFSYAIVFFLIPLVYVNGKRQNQFIGSEIIYLFAILLGMGLLIYPFNFEFVSLIGRYRGLLGNPNGLGIFLTVSGALFYSLYKQNFELAEQRKFLLIFYILFGTSLIISGSRTALIAVMMFIVFIRLKRMSNWFIFTVFVVLVGSYEYLIQQLPVIASFFGLSDYLRLDTLEEGSGRFVAWNFAWTHVQSSLLIGGGFSNTEYLFSTFSGELSRLGHQGNAHNSFLTVWLDTGLVGLLLFVTGLIRSSVRAIHHSPYALPLLLGVLFSTYFESWFSASLNPFTTIFLLALTSMMMPEYSNVTETQAEEQDQALISDSVRLPDKRD